MDFRALHSPPPSPVRKSFDERSPPRLFGPTRLLVIVALTVIVLSSIFITALLVSQAHAPSRPDQTSLARGALKSALHVSPKGHTTSETTLQLSGPSHGRISIPSSTFDPKQQQHGNAFDTSQKESSSSTLMTTATTTTSRGLNSNSSSTHLIPEDAIQKIYSTSDMGIHQATFTGSWKNHTLRVRAWYRFLCSSSSSSGEPTLLVRGFALAEPLTDPVPFFIDHPVLPDYSQENNLHQLQLLLSHANHDTTSPTSYQQDASIPLTQLHRSRVHRNIPNVWHFQGALNPNQAAAAFALGVQGWSSYSGLIGKPSCNTMLESTGAENRGQARSGKPYRVLQTQQQQQLLPWQQQGGVWSVVATAQGVPLDQHAFLLQQHLQYHGLLGLSGMIHIVKDAAVAPQLLMGSRDLQAASIEGRLIFWVWVSAK